MHPTLRIAAAACTMLCLGSASAQGIVNFSTKGTVAQGTDYSGIFTTPGGDLANLPFSLTISADTGYLEDRYIPGGHIAEAPGIGVRLKFEGELVVNGHHYPLQASSGYGTVDLFASPDRLSYGITAQGGTPMFSLGIGLASAHPATGLTDSTAFDQTILFTDAMPVGLHGIEVSVGGTVPSNQQGFYLYADPSYALWSAAPVPEPAQGALWLAGLGVLAVARGRRAALSAAPPPPPPRTPGGSA